MTYATFWQRVGASLIDFLIWLPLLAFMMWGFSAFRLFHLYFLVPGQLLGLWYGVYLVKRYGGTPGKRLLKIRIVRVDGSPVGYREAVIRHVVQAVMGIGSAVALIMARWEMTDAQFHSMTWAVHAEHIAANKPSWSRPLDVVSQVWLWSEFVVMLTNKKRRALHDFIAGTVVVKDVAIPNVVPLPDLV